MNHWTLPVARYLSEQKTVMPMAFDIKQIDRKRTKMKSLVLPEHPSPELAYFCGLLAGDGHIAIRRDKSDYLVFCAGNPADEKEFYDEVVCPLILSLFSIKVHARIFQKTYGVLIRSKPLVRYLTEVLSLPYGRKYDQLRIPFWIKQDKELVRNFIRGLADTDFSVCLKCRYKTSKYYPVITGCSESKSFMEEIAKELERFGMNISRHYDYGYEDKRLKNGAYEHQRIHIYGHEQLVKWVNAIGFSSPKHLKKVQLWFSRNQDSNRAKVKLALEEIRKVGVLENPL